MQRRDFTSDMHEDDCDDYADDHEPHSHKSMFLDALLFRGPAPGSLVNSTPCVPLPTLVHNAAHDMMLGLLMFDGDMDDDDIFHDGGSPLDVADAPVNGVLTNTNSSLVNHVQHYSDFDAAFSIFPDEGAAALNEDADDSDILATGVVKACADRPALGDLSSYGMPLPLPLLPMRENRDCSMSTHHAMPQYSATTQTRLSKLRWRKREAEQRLQELQHEHGGHLRRLYAQFVRQEDAAARILWRRTFSAHALPMSACRTLARLVGR